MNDRGELLALAKDYERGLQNMRNSGYEEFNGTIRTHQMVIDALRLAASPSGGAVREGYVLMPREATRAMTMASCDCLPSCEHVFGHAGELLRNCYSKMVEVAAIDALPAPADDAAVAWRGPTPQMLSDDPLFDAIWQTIKSWDINVPAVYSGYCGATGNHVRAIYDAVNATHPAKAVDVEAVRAFILDAMGYLRVYKNRDEEYVIDDESVGEVTDRIAALRAALCATPQAQGE